MISHFQFPILWGLFYAGFATSTLLQAKTSVSSASNNLQNIKQWLSLHWAVVWANLFLSTAFSALIFKMIPAGTGLGQFGTYAAAGFIANSVIDKILFIFGQQIGLKVEVPALTGRIAPEVNFPAAVSADPAQRWP